MRLFHDLIDRSPGLMSNRDAVRFSGSGVAYGELQERSARVAAGLRSLGVGRGDRVVIHLQNRPEVVDLAIACSRLGAIFVPVSPALKARQLSHVVEDSGACVLASTSSMLSHADELSGASLRHLVCVDLPGANAAPADHDPRWIRWDDLRASPPLARTTPVTDNDVAAILYTSGSTGRPKGVVLSHRNVVSGASCVSEYLGNTSSDRILAALPLSFDYGLSQVTTALYVGATTILTNFSLPKPLIDEAASESITGLAGVPTMWAHLVTAKWPPAALKFLRYITNSGGALHPALSRGLRELMPGVRIFSMYGLTEAFRSTYLDPSELQMRPGSIGKAIPNQEVLVLRPDGTRCAPGETGELVHRGSLVALGYWNDPVRTARRFRPIPAGLLPGAPPEMGVWSGDLARTDDDGYLYFLGRVDGMIKTSGYRVSPTEIEEAVVEVPGVAQAVAVGIPNETLGQQIAVAIVSNTANVPDLLERVRRHCRMQLPAYMVPAELCVLEKVPVTPNGKADRGALERLFSKSASTAPESEPADVPSACRDLAPESSLTPLRRRR